MESQQQLNPHEGPTSPLARGTYSPPTPSDTRGPCPMLNTLANHGYIPRSGQNIRASEITLALHDVVGVSSVVATLFTYPIFFVHRNTSTNQQPPSPNTNKSWFSRTWHRVRTFNPLTTLIFRWGMRRPGQRDPLSGAKVINLDQLATPHAIEHDISLTRRDRAQPEGCITKQPDLIQALLSCASAGSTQAHGTGDSQMITIQDLASFRKRRITEQKEANPGCVYGKLEHTFACMEIALFMQVFGHDFGGKEVPCEYARAFFADERLPFEEGWVGRGVGKYKGWWKGGRLGLFELVRASGRVRGMFGSGREGC